MSSRISLLQAFHSSRNWMGLLECFFSCLTTVHWVHKDPHLYPDLMQIARILISNLMPWLDETLGVPGGKKIYFACEKYVNYWGQRIDSVTQLLQIIAPRQSITAPRIHYPCALTLGWPWNLLWPWGHQQTWCKQRLIKYIGVNPLTTLLFQVTQFAVVCYTAVSNWNIPYSPSIMRFRRKWNNEIEALTLGIIMRDKPVLPLGKGKRWGW